MRKTWLIGVHSLRAAAALMTLSALGCGLSTRTDADPGAPIAVEECRDFLKASRECQTRLLPAGQKDLADDRLAVTRDALVAAASGPSRERLAQKCRDARTQLRTVCR